MKRPTDFWARVHLVLDDRRDPLEDSGVQDAIAVEPELLDELMLLRARLRALPVQHARPRILLATAAAAVAIAAGAIAYYVSRTSASTAAHVAQLATPTHASFAQSEILDFELSISTERPGARDTVIIDRSGTRRTRERDADALEHSILTTEVSIPRGR
jgi:hypothetical protein